MSNHCPFSLSINFVMVSVCVFYISTFKYDAGAIGCFNFDVPVLFMCSVLYIFIQESVRMKKQFRVKVDTLTILHNTLNINKNCSVASFPTLKSHAENTN